MRIWGYQTQKSVIADILNIPSNKFIGPGVDTEAWRQACSVPGLEVIYRRHYEPSAQIFDDPAVRARMVADDILRDLEALGPRPERLLAEGWNECGLWEQADAYSEFTVHLARILGGEGIPHLAYSFSVGNPSGYSERRLGETIKEWVERSLRPYWAHYLPGLSETVRYGGGLGLHEYLSWWDESNVPWLFGRHRLAHMALPPYLKGIPIYINEWGADRDMKGTNTGYRSYLSPLEYVALMRRAHDYLAESLRMGVNLRAVHVFGRGLHSDWSTFDTEGDSVVEMEMVRLNNEGGNGDMASIEVPDGIVSQLRADLSVVLETPEAYADWYRQGGRLRDGYVQMMKATGRLAVEGRADIDNLLTDIGGDIQEIREILNRLPPQ